MTQLWRLNVALGCDALGCDDYMWWWSTLTDYSGRLALRQLQRTINVIAACACLTWARGLKGINKGADWPLNDLLRSKNCGRRQKRPLFNDFYPLNTIVAQYIRARAATKLIATKNPHVASNTATGQPAGAPNSPGQSAPALSPSRTGRPARTCGESGAFCLLSAQNAAAPGFAN